MWGGGPFLPASPLKPPDFTASACVELGCPAWPHHPGLQPSAVLPSAARPASRGGAGPFPAPLPAQRLAPLFPASSLLLLFGVSQRAAPVTRPLPRRKLRRVRGGRAERGPLGRSGRQRSPFSSETAAGHMEQAPAEPQTRAIPFGFCFCFFRPLSAPSPLKNKKNLALSFPVPLPPSCGSKDSRSPRPPPTRPLAVWPLQSLSRPWHLPSSRVTSASCIPRSLSGSRLPRPSS